MADLNPLIRWRKYVIDEKQKVLSSLYREAENLQQKRDKMESDLAHEKELASNSEVTEATTYYGRYAEVQRKKIAQMDGAIAKINARIERAQDEIRAAFADLKKVQITQKNREDREEAEQNRKETIMLDEIGLETFRRNDETKE
ncbi:flagellar FliJ family protein [Micavibrio aeruginosavorus]|uniref:Flagellar FliJ protein n=1 Tax=Micavibrio aeruginosavorus EPB TaxID=349215 RepID=M4VDR0_9BACT|nr:flagellar FliJ family protein [Micavibrio aeruginosavorus]AGH97487.1 hypothetical protein A11S_663 [Micavibrio aeruginosavorus EPB]